MIAFVKETDFLVVILEIIANSSTVTIEII